MGKRPVTELTSAALQKQQFSTCDMLVVVPQSAGYQPTVPESLGALLGKILIPGADSRTTEFTIITIITAAAAASQMNKLRLKEIKSCDYRPKYYQQDRVNTTVSNVKYVILTAMGESFQMKTTSNSHPMAPRREN